MLLFALLLLQAGKGDDANRFSALLPSYAWEIAATCDSGALLVRAPLYPGRLGIFRDEGCSFDTLAFDARQVAADHGQITFAVPLEWEEGPRAFSACNGDDCVDVEVAVAAAKYPQSFIGVDKKFIAPSPEDDARIKRDRQHISAANALAELMPERLWHGDFILPRPPDFTSVFGSERIITDKKKKNGDEKRTRHLGLDFDGASGDPIVAANAGLVTLAEDLFYSGRTIFLAHGGGLVTTYFHMTEMKVHSGDFVVAGTLLGTVGKSGRVTGPHLHFAAKWNGTYFDPWELFESDVFGAPICYRPPCANYSF